MATIKTAIMVQDSMSSALRSMSNACRILVNNFEDMRNASSNTVDVQSLKIARNELNNTDMILRQTEEQMKKVNQESRRMPSGFESAVPPADNLLNKVKQIAIAAGGIMGLKKILNLSDEMATTNARLDLIVDDGGSVEQLENKIFASAMRSRASYQDTADMISKLGSQAGGAFKNNDELIAFAEQLNKNFVLAGTNQQGIASAQLQLTQALASRSFER